MDRNGQGSKQENPRNIIRDREFLRGSSLTTLITSNLAFKIESSSP